MAVDIWRRLLDAPSQNKVIRVELTPGARIMRPRRAKGRPRTRGANRWAHFAGYRGKGRPKCALRGCTRYLRIKDRLCCSPEHEAKVVAAAKAMLTKAGL